MIRFLIPLLLLVIPFGMSAQEIRTNEKGEKIIVYADGSWRYFNTNDNTLFGSDGTVFEQDLVPTDPKEREAYFEEKARKEAILLANQSSLETSRFEVQYEKRRSQRFDIEAELAELKRQSTGQDNTEAISDLEEDLVEAKRAEVDARFILRKAQELADMTEGMIDMNRKKRNKQLERYEELYAELYGIEEAVIVETPPAVRPPEPGKPLTAGQFVSYNPNLDVMVNPPEDDCVLAFDGVDEFSGKQRRDTKMETFFTSTRDELRPYMNGKDYITCRGQLTSLSGGLLFLSLEFTIASKSAQQSFGGLPKGSLISVKLLNGESLRIQNSKGDYGTYNPVTESFTFRGQFMIAPHQERAFMNAEVDKIRVNWGTGYEDYEIYEMDFFSHLMRCLFDE